VSQAIFKELRNDEVDDEGNKPEGANLFFGTYIGKDSSEAPDGVRKMLKRSKPNLAMTYISKCDLIVYDLHSGNPEDVQLALDAMNKPKIDDDPGQEKVIILISSLLAWDATPRNLEAVQSPEDADEEARAKIAAATVAPEKPAEADAEGEEDKAEEEGAAPEEPSSPKDDVNSNGKKSGAEGEVPEGEEAKEEEAAEEEA